MFKLTNYPLNSSLISYNYNTYNSNIPMNRRNNNLTFTSIIDITKTLHESKLINSLLNAESSNFKTPLLDRIIKSRKDLRGIKTIKLPEYGNIKITLTTQLKERPLMPYVYTDNSGNHFTEPVGKLKVIVDNGKEKFEYEDPKHKAFQLAKKIFGDEFTDYDDICQGRRGWIWI